jgi:hypothetical protein
VATGQELLNMRRLGASMVGLLFSPDGRHLVGESSVFSSQAGLRFLSAPAFSETDVADAGAVTR